MGMVRRPKFVNAVKNFIKDPYVSDSTLKISCNTKPYILYITFRSGALKGD